MAFSLILRGYEQSERVNDAMCMRGFSGRFRSMEEPEADLIRDIFLSVLFFVFPVVMISAEYCVW